MNSQGNIQTQRFEGTALAVNALTNVPATVNCTTDGQPFGSATTTALDLQATFTINQNADGSFPEVNCALG